MKVFLGNGPWRVGNRIGIRAGSRWPFTLELSGDKCQPKYLPFPFFLAYAAALLEKEGYDVLLVDAIAEGMGEELFLNRIKDYEPELVLLETSTPSIDIDLAMAKRIKEGLKEVKLALSGPHVSVLGEDIFRQNLFIDYILAGEYEYTLLELATGKILKDISGLAYRDGDEIKINPRRPAIEDLDHLPWPARHFLPMDRYNDAFCGLPVPSLQMWASRGCPYRCIFCMWPEVMYGGHKYRVRDPAKVVDEIEWCVKRYNFKSVYFDDDIFNIGKERIMRISQGLKKRIGLPWAIMARADIMDREMLKAMSDSGLYALKYGAESGAQEVLDRSGKDLDLGKLREVVRLTKEFGIKVHLTFTFGLPGETKETIQKTIDFAAGLDPDSVQFSLTIPFPGTEYFDIAKRNGLLISKDWSKFDGATKGVVRTDSLSAEDLEKALGFAMKRFEMARFKKKKWYYLKKGFQHPFEAAKKVYEYINA